jgi:biopolymer transport protein ExbB
MSAIIETTASTFAAIGSLRDFMELGGIMMWVIALASFILWTLILERLYFFSHTAQKILAGIKKDWASCQNNRQIKFIRAALIAQYGRKNISHLSFIKALVAVVPFLGLLGTVTGMIEVFDALAQTGANNAQAMASGVSKATLPTMAGMIVALSGLYFNNVLERRAKKNMRACENLLEIK